MIWTKVGIHRGPLWFTLNSKEERLTRRTIIRFQCMPREKYSKEQNKSNYAKNTDICTLKACYFFGAFL